MTPKTDRKARFFDESGRELTRGEVVTRLKAWGREILRDGLLSREKDEGSEIQMLAQRGGEKHDCDR